VDEEVEAHGAVVVGDVMMEVAKQQFPIPIEPTGWRRLFRRFLKPQYYPLQTIIRAEARIEKRPV
jgi:hypothetical protein